MNGFLASTGAAAAYPEMFLACAAMALLMLGVFWEKANEAANFFAVAALGLAAVLVLAGTSGEQVAFGGAFVSDGFARLMKLLVLFGSAAAIVLSFAYMRQARIMRFEYPVLVLLSATGMMMMISANDLIALYVGLELQSLALYVVASFHRENAKSSEAGLKYFVLGALSSGMLLYGASLIYGFTGATGFAGIAMALSAGEPGLGLVFGLVFLIAGLAFKVSAVPFHMWTPDVYEGAPTPVTAFFASAPKVAAMALFTRVMTEPFAHSVAQWQQVVVFISIASMALGAFAAIGQTNIKRLLAYSSIANMGFAMVGLAAANEEGVRGVVLYMMIYMIMTLGAFACVLAMRRRGAQVEEISDLAGLARTDKWLAFVFAALMFSLAGIPPLAGFFAKYFVFMAAVKSGLWTLAILGVIASVVGAFYYLRVVKIMYFDEPAEAFEPMAPEVRFIAIVSGIFTVAFMIFAQPLVALAADAARSLFS
jgi:NADH-quinone oxidoreductase subunit N